MSGLDSSDLSGADAGAAPAPAEPSSESSIDTSSDNAAPAAPKTLREDLEAAFAAAERDEAGRTPPSAKPGERQRDEAGRFAPATPPASPPSQRPVTQPAPRPQGQAQGAISGEGGERREKEMKAPGQWTPSAREKWAGVDPEVQTEILRREAEFTRHAMSAAVNRDFVAAFQQIVQPYEMFIRQENSNPLAAVQNLMQTAAELRVGTPQSKAVLIANLIGQYGIDVQLLDSYLAHQRDNGVGWAAYAPPRPQGDPRVDQLMNMFAQQQAQAQAQQRYAIEQEIESFAADHEFYNDVHQRMAALIEAEAAQNRALTMEDAYELACQMDEGVRKIRATRAQAQAASQNTQAAQRARRAASSVKGESTAGAGPVTPKDDSIRAHLEAAWEAASNRM